MGSIRASFILFGTFLFSVVFFTGILPSVGLGDGEYFSFGSTPTGTDPDELLTPWKGDPGSKI